MVLNLKATRMYSSYLYTAVDWTEIWSVSDHNKKVVNLNNESWIRGVRASKNRKCTIPKITWDNLKVWPLYFLFVSIHNGGIGTFQKQPREVFFKKRFLKNFASFTRKHLCWNLFLIKLNDFGPATLLKRESNTGAFL